MDPASRQPRSTSTCALRGDAVPRETLFRLAASFVVRNSPLWAVSSAVPEFLPLPSSLQPLAYIPFQNNSMSTE